MKTKIKIFETGLSDGIMSRNKKFYSEKISQEDINKKFLETRVSLGKKHGFNGQKMFQALQKNDINKINYEDGKYIVLNEKYMNKDDFWYEELPADILILEEKYKNVVVGNQMADCPILIVEDRNKGVTALSHCGAPYINRELPYQTVQCLITEYNSNSDDLYAYIGSCAKKDSYIYDKYPLWATNKEIWNGYIIKSDDNYNIDLVGAIVRQLNQIGVKNIEISPNDTITHKNYYSHNASSKGKTNKKGQNFVGFFYE